MEIYVVKAIYMNTVINLVITEDTDMENIKKNGVDIPDEDKKESFAEYKARKKRDRSIKRIQDERKRKDKERKSAFSFEDFVMDYYE